MQSLLENTNGIENMESFSKHKRFNEEVFYLYAHLLFYLNKKL